MRIVLPPFFRTGSYNVIAAQAAMDGAQTPGAMMKFKASLKAVSKNFSHYRPALFSRTAAATVVSDAAAATLAASRKQASLKRKLISVNPKIDRRCNLLERRIGFISSDDLVSKIRRECPMQWHSHMVARELKLSDCLSRLEYLHRENLSRFEFHYGDRHAAFFDCYTETIKAVLCLPSEYHGPSLGALLEEFKTAPMSDSPTIGQPTVRNLSALIRRLSMLNLRDARLENRKGSLEGPATFVRTDRLTNQFMKTIREKAIPISLWFGKNAGNGMPEGSELHREAIAKVQGLINQIRIIRV